MGWSLLAMRATVFTVVLGLVMSMGGIAFAHWYTEASLSGGAVTGGMGVSVGDLDPIEFECETHTFPSDPLSFIRLWDPLVDPDDPPMPGGEGAVKIEEGQMGAVPLVLEAGDAIVTITEWVPHPHEPGYVGFRYAVSEGYLVTLDVKAGPAIWRTTITGEGLWSLDGFPHDRVLDLTTCTPTSLQRFLLVENAGSIPAMSFVRLGISLGDGCSLFNVAIGSLPPLSLCDVSDLWYPLGLQSDPGDAIEVPITVSVPSWLPTTGDTTLLLTVSALLVQWNADPPLDPGWWSVEASTGLSVGLIALPAALSLFPLVAVDETPVETADPDGTSPAPDETGDTPPQDLPAPPAEDPVDPDGPAPPPGEEPPADEPPAYEPPSDEPPPVDEPPAEPPPADEAPSEEPPSDEPPPADEPPADEPPADEPPGDEPPPADEPPAEESPADESTPESVELGSISGYVWMEHDGDRLLVLPGDTHLAEGAEGGLEGITVTLVDPLGQVVAEQSTDSSGAYLFDALRAGTYTVQLNLPKGLGPANADLEPWADLEAAITDLATSLEIDPALIVADDIAEVEEKPQRFRVRSSPVAVDGSAVEGFSDFALDQVPIPEDTQKKDPNSVAYRATEGEASATEQAGQDDPPTGPPTDSSGSETPDVPAQETEVAP